MIHNLKKILSVLITVCLVFTLVIPVYAQGSDISNHWAQSAFEKWTAEGLLKGYSDGSYRPNNIVTKAEFLAFIERIFKYTDTSEKKSKDVPLGSWYEGYISKALAAGIIQENSNGNIEPQQAITRGAAAAILAKAFDLKANSLDSIKKYTDYGSIPYESCDAIAAMTEKGFINGNADKSFGYSRPVTRAEAITMINRTMGTVIKSSGTYKSSVSSNLTVNTKDVVLKDMTIEGDLYLTQGIGQGDVTLENVKVKGKTFVFGGGVNSIKVKDSVLSGTLILLKKDGKVRVITQGNTEIANTEFYSGAILEEEGLAGKGFVDLTIKQINPASNEIRLSGGYNNIVVNDKGAKLQLLTGSANTLTVADSASGTEIYMDTAFMIDVLKTFTGLKVSGKGMISDAGVLSAGVEFEQAPSILFLSEGITVIVAGSVRNTGYSSTGSTGSPGGTIPTEPTVTPTPVPTSVPTAVPTSTPTAVPTEVPTPTNVPVEPTPTPTTVPADISGTVSFAEPPADITLTNIQLKQNGTNTGSVIHPDDTGAYSISGLSAGTYIIEVSLEGYKTFTTESFEFTGSAINGKDITVEKSAPTLAGDFWISPNKGIPGDIRTLYVAYESDEKLVNGTVVFTLPKEFKATANDRFYIGTMSSVVGGYLTDDQISNDGTTITLTNVTTQTDSDKQYINLYLDKKAVPAVGVYDFSITADADGILTEKSPNPAMSYWGYGSFTSANGPVEDLRAVARDTAIDFAFSKCWDSTSVVLEMSTDGGATYSNVPGVNLTSASSSATVTGLANGEMYMFRLVAAGGSHAGTTEPITISPTKLSLWHSFALIDTPLTVNTDGTFNKESTITIYFRDKNGNPINNANESFILHIYDDYNNINKIIYLNGSDIIGNPNNTGFAEYDFYNVQTDSNGKVTLKISLKLTGGSDYHIHVYLSDSNNYSFQCYETF